MFKNFNQKQNKWQIRNSFLDLLAFSQPKYVFYSIESLINMDGQENADNFSRFLIIGGGISGLSAASTLTQRGIKDFRLVIFLQGSLRVMSWNM